MRQIMCGTLMLCLGWGLASAAAAPQVETLPTQTGVKVPQHFKGRSFIESMSDVLQRQAFHATEAHSSHSKRGYWAVPSTRSLTVPHSGSKYIINKGGALQMGIGFSGPVWVEHVYVVGQAQEGVWPAGLRVIGFRDGVEVGRTPWFETIDKTPRRMPINLGRIDRIVFEAKAAFKGRAWYGLDDLAFKIDGTFGSGVILDFEDTRPRQRLSGSTYATLRWETGPEPKPRTDDMPAPRVADEQLVASGEAPTPPAPAATSGASVPVIFDGFQSVTRGDAGSAAFPPDSHGAIGINHYVVAVNRNFAIHDRATGAELLNVYLGSFLPGANGDPRVVFDHFANRWYVVASDFSDTGSLFLAISMSADPMGSWFKASIDTDVETNFGCWPDYPTLGFDEAGIYVAAWMAGGCGNTIWVFDKSLLIAPEPQLGKVVFFPNLASWQVGYQPAISHGGADGFYFVTAGVFTDIIVRKISGPISEPVLTDIGSAVVAHFFPPPSLPALGSVTNLDHTIGKRVLNAVYRDGSLWTCHDVEILDRSGINWYEIDVATMTAVQSGVIADPLLHFYYGSIAVNGAGDVIVGCTGSDATQYASAYVFGRKSTDPAGAMSPPQLLRAGAGSQNNVDSQGRNRWGDYSMTTVDPLDDTTFWSIQEYAQDTDIWGTWVGHVGFESAPLEFEWADGVPEQLDPRGETFPIIITAPGSALDANSPRLHYMVDGQWSDVPLLSQGGGAYEVVFPALPCPSEVAFYLSAQTIGGAAGTEPDHAPTVSYEVSATDMIVLLADNVESTGGWIVGDAMDTATAGVWTLVDPIGTTAQPEDDHTPGGTRCFVTGQGTVDGEPTDSDVDGGRTTLYSPRYNVSGQGDAVISYWRWYSNSTSNSPSDNGGTTPAEDIFTVDISADGVEWFNVETLGPVTPWSGWALHAFRPAEVVDISGTVQLRFVTSDEGNDSIIEAAIDDVRITLVLCDDHVNADTNGDGLINVDDLVTVILEWGVCGDPCPADTNGDGSVDVDDLISVILSWTNDG